MQLCTTYNIANGADIDNPGIATRFMLLFRIRPNSASCYLSYCETLAFMQKKETTCQLD